jgi:hypothetical protein
MLQFKHVAIERNPDEAYTVGGGATHATPTPSHFLPSLSPLFPQLLVVLK